MRVQTLNPKMERKYIYVVKYNGEILHTLPAHTVWEAIDRTWNEKSRPHMNRRLMTATKSVFK